MNLVEIGKKYGTDKVTHGYLDIYGKYFNQFNKNSKILEIGIYQGNSLRTFKEYLNCDVWGLDIRNNCIAMEKEGYHIIVGSQSDKSVLDKLPNFDLIIDDGSHQNDDILFSFKELFPKLNKDGLYIIEDLHASYMLKERGNKREDMEELFLKLIRETDKLNSDIEYIHFYRKVCIIKKK